VDHGGDAEVLAGVVDEEAVVNDGSLEAVGVVPAVDLPPLVVGNSRIGQSGAVMEEPTITHLERRKIEAGVLIPMVQAFQRAMGKERANDIAREVIRQLAREDGARWAERFGTDLAALEQVTGLWAAGGSLVIEPINKSAERLDFNVVRCQYAEFYKDLGLPELGYLFHCSRDFAMVEGFSPGLTLRRTQTIMEGASHCDFRFALRGTEEQ